MKKVILFMTLLLLVSAGMSSCKGRNMGGGKQKKGCNCGF